MADAPYSLKRLVPADLDLFRGMLDLFGEAFDDPETYTGAQPDDHYLRGLLTGDGFIALVAVSDATVIGGLAAYVLKKFERQRSEVYIYDIAVADTHLRRGIATALIEHMKIVAGQCGAHVIYVQADLEDDPAIALYTKMGVREDVLHFDIAVPPAG